jgi:hypothetical protein
VRALNVLLSSIAPVLLVALLRGARELRWLAGAILALSPTLLVHGASSQLEPPVLVLTLAACLAWERAEKWPMSVAGGVALAAAALIRYEAWAAALALSLLWLRVRQPWHRALVWIMPALAIALWCVHHRLASGEWLQFLRYNREFAGGYLAGVGYPWGSQPNAALALAWYVTVVPWIEQAVLAPLSLLGAVWFVRSAPRSLAVVELAMLAFLALGFALGQHLGLPRHGLVLAPLYACCLAAGIVRARDGLGAGFAPRRVVGSLAALGAVRPLPGYLQGLERHTSAYRAELAAARALRREFRDDDSIFCDRGSIEVLSSLPPSRFTRWPLRDVDAFQLKSAARDCHRTLVLSDLESTAHLTSLTQELYSDGSLVLLSYAACDR